MKFRLAGFLASICQRPFSLRQMSVSAKHPFDRNAKLLQRERSARLEDQQVYDYLKDGIGEIMADKILDIKIDVETVLDLGCGKGSTSKHLPLEKGMKTLHMAEYSPALLDLSLGPGGNVEVVKKVVDEELPLPYEDESFDLVVSNLSLHWVNKLPECFREVRRVLKKDRPFILSMFGEDTLYELRSSLVLAELEREGGVASHISPFIKIPDLGFLLNQAGFHMLTFDSENITIGYPSLYELLFDLKGMGENNASVTRALHLPRNTMLAASAIYKEVYGDDKGVPATYKVVFGIGWKPDPKNPVKVAERGSGEVSLKDIEKLNKLLQEHGAEGRIKLMEELVNQNKDGDGDK